MKKYLVTCDAPDCPTITTWQPSARNAIFAYKLSYRTFGAPVSATEIIDEVAPVRAEWFK